MRRILKQAMLVLAAVLMMAAAGCGQQEEPAEQAAQTPPVQQEQAPDDPQEEEQPEVATPSLTAQIQQAQQKNEDIVGWLRIDDTGIDGAVVQGKGQRAVQAPERVGRIQLDKQLLCRL